MRHGEALSPQVDPERGLSENGKQKIELVASQLKKEGINFKQIIHSKKKRARETAEIMARITSPNIKPLAHQHISPNDDPEFILTELNSWDEDTLVASHLPFVPNLITALTGQDAYLTNISFETGTVVCLENNDNGAWSIKWSTSPSEVTAI